MPEFELGYESEAEKPKMKKAVVILLFLAAALIASVFLVKTTFSRQNNNASVNSSVVNGNFVLIDYTGYLGDGSIFDTSIRKEALKVGIFSPSASYKPLQFQVGSKRVLSGLENAVIGMTVGEQKEVELQPKDAYGDPDPSKRTILPRIREIDRVLVLNRITPSPLSQYREAFNKEPTLNELVSNKELPGQFKIIEIRNQTIFLEHLLEKGQRIVMPQTGWESVVEEVTDSHILIKQDPQDGQKIQTSIGEAKLIVTDNKIIIKSNPKIGEVVETPTGTGKISGVDETSVIVDSNHPLAGKTLRFKIILLNISNEPIPETIEEELPVCPDTVEGNKSADLKVKYFYTPFCPWCIKEEPILDEMLKDYGHLFHIERYDIRFCPEQVKQYQVTGTPSFVFSTENGAKEFFIPSFIKKDKLKEIICNTTNECGLRRVLVQEND
jgi:FKBP-type peptidyl-prolyl cis-trans isomerase 2